MLREPRRFFSRMPPEPGIKRPLGVLSVSSLIFATAGILSARPANPAFYGCVLFVNAMGMSLIAAGIGYGIVTMVMGRRVSYAKLLRPYAFAAGLTLLFAWLPFSLWITEPWKWYLVGTGLIRGCALKRSQAVIIIGVSIGVMTFLFWPVLSSMAPKLG